MKIASSVSLVVVCALIIGCSSVSKMPQELDISRALIIEGGNETVVVIDGLPGKSSGAVVGAGTGAGVGFGAAALGCIGTGPLYPFCLAAVGTVAGTVGAVGGAVTGTVITESADGVETKRQMLTEALIALDASHNLAPLVYKKSLESLAVKPSQQNIASTTVDPEFRLRIVLEEFASVGSGPDTPYSLQLFARVEIIRLGDKEPTFVNGYQAKSSIEMTTSEWRSNDDEPVRSALDGMLATLVTDISNDLKPIQLSLDQPFEKYKVSVEPVATEMKTEPAAVLNSEAKQMPPLAQEETSNPDQPALFDPITRLNWIVVDSGPVNLSTANSICRSLEMGDKKKYRLPSLSEFEVLWKGYKGDGQIIVFNKKEYNTSDEDSLTRAGYTKTFSFENGTSGNLYAAYLSCVSK